MLAVSYTRNYPPTEFVLHKKPSAKCLSTESSDILIKRYYLLLAWMQRCQLEVSVSTSRGYGWKRKKIQPHATLPLFYTLHDRARKLYTLSIGMRRIQGPPALHRSSTEQLMDSVSLSLTYGSRIKYWCHPIRPQSSSWYDYQNGDFHLMTDWSQFRCIKWSNWLALLLIHGSLV